MKCLLRVRKCNKIEVTFWFCCGMKFDTKINAILVISELMASAGKVLRHFRRHGEKFLIDKFLPSS